jgi:hypothetical protein
MPLSDRDYYRDNFRGSPKPPQPKRSLSGCGCLLTVIVVVIMLVIIVGVLSDNQDSNYQTAPTTSPTPSPKPPPVETPEPTPVPIPTPSTPPPAPEPEPKPTSTPAPPEKPTTQLEELPSIIKEVSQSTEVITREHTWTYKGEWTWEGTISQSMYEYYQEMPRPPTKNYSVYVTHPLDDTYIEHIVEKIQEAAQEAEFSEYETIEFAASFVQSLPYTADSITTPYDEYPRYPVETLVDKGGDCEDTSILLASLIDKMGYGVVLIELPDHCAVGVKGGENVYGTYWEYEGSKYYYIETTDKGWEIGQLPEEYENTSADIYPMIPTPILTHDWSIEGKGNVGELEVTVYNLGTATAYNVSVLAGFDAGEDMLWNGRQSDYFQIRPDHQVTVTLKIPVPLGKHTRLVVQIGIDNNLVDDSHSKWFDT